MSCPIFMIDHILSDQSWKFRFDFGVDRTYMIGQVIILSGLHHRPYTIDQSQQFIFIFGKERMILCPTGVL